jgi:hypothetical protein
VLYNRDRRFAQILLELLHREDGLVVGDNEPYSVTDASDYTIPVHGEQRDLHHVALEIRQDLITDEAGQRMWARCLRDCFRKLISGSPSGSMPTLRNRDYVGIGPPSLQVPKMNLRARSERGTPITSKTVAFWAFVHPERG